MSATLSLGRGGQLTVLAVLGLSGRGTDEWAKLRGFQYSQLAKVARTRLITQALAAIVVAFLYGPVVGWGHVLGWLGALCGSLTYTTRGDWALANADRRRVTREEFLRQAGGTVINALVWVSVLLLFTPRGAQHAHFEVWTVLAMLMTVSAVIVPTVPLATMLFSGIVGGASIWSFIHGGYPEMAAVAALFVSCIAMGAVDASRNFLKARMAESSMAERNEVVSLLLRESEEEGADWLWHLDKRHRVRAAGRRFADALGLTPADAEGKSLLQLIAGPNWESGHLDTSINELATRLKHRDGFAALLVRVNVMGKDRCWEMSGAPRWDENGLFEGFHGVASDVTEQRESSDRIAYLARFDTLTGLPNRMQVTETLNEVLNRAIGWTSSCALMMLDLDKFKAVNDTLGHPVGDGLLTQVADA